MRSGPRVLLAALVAATLAVAAPAAQAKGGSSSGQKPTSATRAPKVPALAADLAHIEPLPLTGGAASTVTLQGVGEYRGLLEVRRAAGGVGAVHEVALDDYLKGISEVPPRWPAEALRAPAVAAPADPLWGLRHGPRREAARP